MELIYLFFLVCVFPATLMVQASEALKNSAGNSTAPSAATLTGCRRSCGAVTFEYPFGIDPGCFRNADFKLTCDDTSLPRKLFLRDGATQVYHNIVTTDNFAPAVFSYDNLLIPITISHVIPMISGVYVYNMYWDSPGSSYSLAGAQLNITGCDFDVHQISQDTDPILSCTASCSTEEITEAVARQNCNGTGCCSIYVESTSGLPIRNFHLRFIRHEKGKLRSTKDGSPLWDRISITSSDADLKWSIIDQPNCASTKENMTNYACISKESTCRDADSYGYYCYCNPGYGGNPYIIDGCSRDTTGYNPVQKREDCSRFCGNISIPFPFGLEEGCYGRETFHLNCTNTSPPVLHLDDKSVSKIEVNEGVIEYSELGFVITFLPIGSLYTPSSGSSASLQWAIANETCLEAQRNKSVYACVSANSMCVPVTSLDRGFFGYRCICCPGFNGNPYIKYGCEDINECLEPASCNGICQNTIGSFICRNCPHKTEYDPIKMECSPTKQRTIVLGIVIGMCTGFSVLILSLCVIFVISQWKKNIQRNLRRVYFQKNQGFLLEQLISCDENASDKTNIFSLDDLKKATNNFHAARKLGSGRHGMVYKGILSDQRVVAVKKSNTTENSEINQFINEVVILSQINHRNIVKLIGCCLETEVPLLVYEFVANGSLFGVLHGNSKAPPLAWSDYLRIATEAAGALCYLHSSASISVFHRDVKSTNILLDGKIHSKNCRFWHFKINPR